MSKGEEQLTKAKAGLVLDKAFWSVKILNKPWRTDASCETGWMDGTQYGFNPEWVESLTLPQTKGFCAHEACHDVLLHNLRRGERDPEDYNAACDYKVNQILLEDGFELPPGYLYDPAFNDKCVEEVYNIIHSRKKKATGKADPGRCGEVRDFPGKTGKATPAEIAQQEQDQKISTQNALAVGQKAGDLPSSLKRLITELLQPIIPWREVLARFIDISSRNDYTWTKPNRRYAAFGVYLPALEAPELGRIGFFDDTSGSHFSEQQQRKALSEVRGILTAYQNTQLTLIFCDYDVQGEPIDLDPDTAAPDFPKPQGGGGTRFSPPFIYAQEHELEFKAVIYATDGECNDFPETPDYPVLWILTEPNPSFNPPFGETIEMRD